MTPDLDALKEQRWALHLGGVSYESWRLMPKWVRDEQYVRLMDEKTATRKIVGNGSLTGILSALVRRILR